MSDQPTREEITKAMSRKLVEGATPGPYETTNVATSCGRAFKINEKGKGEESHGLIACIYDDNTALNSRAHNEHVANAKLMTTAPDLQAEIQTLQALCRRFGRALDLVMADEYAWDELCTEAQEAVVEAQSLMPTKGESGE